MTNPKIGGWTKEEMKELIGLWDKKSVQDIAEKLNRKPNSVLYISYELRKLGVPLARKSQHGKTRLLACEMIKELGIKPIKGSWLDK